MPITPTMPIEFGTFTVEFEGALVRALASPISTTSASEGDAYIGPVYGTNEWELCTFDYHGRDDQVVFSTERPYGHDDHRCFLVVDIT